MESGNLNENQFINANMDNLKALIDERLDKMGLFEKIQQLTKNSESEKEKLEKIKEEKKNDEGAIKRQSDCVFECNGAKIASFQTLKKSYEALKEFIETIETHDDDEDTRKSREEIKGLEEFNEAKKHLENAKEVLDKDEASNAAPEQYAPPNK